MTSTIAGSEGGPSTPSSPLSRISARRAAVRSVVMKAIKYLDV